MSGKVILLSGAPGVGKTSALEALKNFLRVSRPMGSAVIVLDNEDVFTRELRVVSSEKSGLALDSKDFAQSFNRAGQLAYQGLCRKLAAQGFTVLMPGPFENLRAEIPVGDEKVPLLQLMQRQFGGDIVFGQLLLVPEATEVNSSNVMTLPSMLPIEEEIQKRLKGRQQDATQRALDADKIGDPEYYRKRLQQQLLTAEMFPSEIIKIQTHIGDDSFTVAGKVYDAFFEADDAGL
jgi:hypothetical protein